MDNDKYRILLKDVILKKVKRDFFFNIVKYVYDNKYFFCET